MPALNAAAIQNGAGVRCLPLTASSDTENTAAACSATVAETANSVPIKATIMLKTIPWFVPSTNLPPNLTLPA